MPLTGLWGGGDFVVASWNGVQVRVDLCSSQDGVLWAPSARIWERTESVVRFFLLRGFVQYIFIQGYFAVGGWRWSDSVSYAPVHATLNGMESIGVSSSSG